MESSQETAVIQEALVPSQEKEDQSADADLDLNPPIVGQGTLHLETSAPKLPEPQPLPVLSQDDDFLSDLLVDRLYLRHLNKSSRKINADFAQAEVDMAKVQRIARRLKRATRDPQKRLRRATAQFYELDACKNHVQHKTASQLKAFDNHLKRYLEIHFGLAGFRICTTSRYLTVRAANRTEPRIISETVSSGKIENDNLSASTSASTSNSDTSETVASTATSHSSPSAVSKMAAAPDLASTSSNHNGGAVDDVQSPAPSADVETVFESAPVLDLAICATRPYQIGETISHLSGSLADLTNDQDDNLRQDRNGMQSDFSVLMNPIRRVFQLFLGPARFCNHDCESNVQMTRSGKSIVFKVVRPIQTGDEICSHYGDDYFDDGNASCMCHSCERNCKGFFKDHKPPVIPKAADANRAKRVRKSLQRDPNYNPTHLGAYVNWDSLNTALFDSDSGLSSGTDSEDSDSIDGDERVPIVFQRKSAIIEQAKRWRDRGWSWLPSNVHVNRFAEIQVDLTEGRMTRTQKRESLKGKGPELTPAQLNADGSMVLTSIASLLETQQVFTYGEWQEKREEIQRAAPSYQESEMREGSTQPLEGDVADEDDDEKVEKKPRLSVQSASSAKRSKKYIRKRKSKSEHAKEEPEDDHEKPLRKKARVSQPRVKVKVADVGIIAEDKAMWLAQRRRTPHVLPQGADPADYNLNVQEDRRAWRGDDSKGAVGDWKVIKGWETADREVREQKGKMLLSQDPLKPEDREDSLSAISD